MLFPCVLGSLVLLAGWTAALEKNLQFPFDLPKGYGPWVHPTAGQVWPKPQMQDTSDNFMILRPSTFQFQVFPILNSLVLNIFYFSIGFFIRSAGKAVIS